MTWRYNNKLYLKVKEKKDVFNDIKKLARKLRKGKAFIEIPDKECTHNSIHSIRSFECTYDFLNSRASDELNILCAIVELGFRAYIYDNNRKIEREWLNDIKIYIGHEAYEEESIHNYIIDIHSDDIGSLFCPDNRFDIMMIYLIDKGVIQGSNEADWDEVVRIFMPYIEHDDLDEIVEELKDIAPVYITIDDYEVYKTSVIKFREGDFKLRDNQELSRLNRDLIENELLYPLAERLGGEIVREIREINIKSI